MEAFDHLKVTDQQYFRKCCNHLLTSGFIVKNIEEMKKDYYFVLKNKELFTHYLEVLGFELNIDELLGVIQLINSDGNYHNNLKLQESIVLLILRILYDEKKRGLLLSDVVVTVDDIQQKYLSLKFKNKQISKVDLKNALSVLRRFNIVRILDKELSHGEDRIIIYDSIALAVSMADITKVSQMLKQYAQKGGTNDEETDESSTYSLA